MGKEKWEIGNGEWGMGKWGKRNGEMGNWKLEMGDSG
jgi:hypothetical protein